jgi:hypothetical protein
MKNDYIKRIGPLGIHSANALRQLANSTLTVDAIMEQPGLSNLT